MIRARNPEDARNAPDAAADSGRSHRGPGGNGHQRSDSAAAPAALDSGAPRRDSDSNGRPATRVASLCPYCGVGCQVTYHVTGNRIEMVTGRQGPSNLGRLCVKGRFGFDYVHNRQRLTTPLIRREGVAKDASRLVDPAHPEEAFREASWEEALDVAAAGLRRVRDEHGGGALAGFGSAKGSNEEAYLFQKLIRAGLGTNNVDHCTRLCHASSVAALFECLGSAAVSNPVADVQFADCIIIIGANPTVNHPVAATFMKNAIERGTKLILADPRRTELARFATLMLQFHPGTDVAFLNSMLHVVVEEGLTQPEFIVRRVAGYDDVARRVKAYAPETMEAITGVPAAEVRAAARLYASAKNSMIFWGMGISQHVHGTDNARSLISLALITGQVGRRGTGLHPLRGQNNVQGASDVGLIPMFYPDYKKVTDPAVREKFERLWGRPGLDPAEGLTVVEIMHAAREGKIRGMYIMGENPAMSDPDVQHVRQAFATLEWLVVQEIFLTETASFADVILPASAFAEKGGTFTNTDRRVQLARPALQPPGAAQPDLWIIQELARRLGLDWDYAGPAAVFEEMRQALGSYAGMTWERLEREHGVTYPCRQVGDPGQEVLFEETFPTPDGLGHLVAADYAPGCEPVDEQFPFVLITGRLLEHWHTGAMTRRSEVLDSIEPAAYASLNPADAHALGLAPGDPLAIESRRGRIVAQLRADAAIPPGAVFLPFCYVEAPANFLTSPELDPFGKIPEFKYSAVRLARAPAPAPLASYGASADAAQATPPAERPLPTAPQPV